MILIRLFVTLVAVLAASATAAQCRDEVHENKSFTICQAHMGQDLRLFHTNAEGVPFGQFFTLSNTLKSRAKQLLFAMNGGMYHPDLSPVGHYIEKGVEKQRVITSEGPGNFGMLPNGVLCINDQIVKVFETNNYLSSAQNCNYATQSGPMLVINGRLHPRFIKDSTSLNIRNGVSVDGDNVYFVISNDRINLHSFATFFRDRLNAQNALYLDGKVSRLYAPNLGRSDFGWPIGPIVGLVADLK